MSLFSPRRAKFNGRRIILGTHDLDLVKGTLLKLQV